MKQALIFFGLKNPAENGQKEHLPIDQAKTNKKLVIITPLCSYGTVVVAVNIYF